MLRLHVLKKTAQPQLLTLPTRYYLGDPPSPDGGDDDPPADRHDSLCIRFAQAIIVQDTVHWCRPSLPRSTQATPRDCPKLLLSEDDGRRPP
jgi:hypothetical protein